MIRLTGKEIGEQVSAIRRQAPASGSILLDKSAVIELLRRCAHHELTALELSGIANELEAFDEIDYEPGAEGLIATVLFEIASPEINIKITPQRCLELIELLRKE